MGGLIGLCGPDGGPCMGNGDSDNKHNRKRDADIEQQKLLNSADSDTTNDSLSIETLSKDTKGIQSIHNIPTKKIEISPIIAKYILPQKQFQIIRQQIESNALKLNDIDKIIFQNDCWLIQGSDSIALEDHRNLFNIIIWRVPIIPAFAHFTNEKQFYNKLKQDNDTFKLQLNTDGIWALSSKEKFIEMFNANILQQIDKIDDKEHDLLADSHKLPLESDEYKDLIEKLHIIEVMKKANEIIIIGQKICVLDLLRVIRKCEVNDKSMSGMFNTMRNSLEWEIKSDDPNAPDPRFITSYYCVISNLSLGCGQPELQELLNKYERWTYAEIIEDDEDESDNENNDKYKQTLAVPNAIDKQIDNDSDSDSESDNENN
eukprot:387417_1